jgi:hypothetical protein
MGIAFSEFGESPIWRGENYRIHSPSQHTIGGTRYDFEITMQMKKTVNVPNSKTDYAKTSIMFSATSPTAVFCTKECITAIDNFFEDLFFE